MSWNLVYFSDCSMWTREKCVFCCFGIVYFMNVNYVSLIVLSLALLINSWMFLCILLLVKCQFIIKYFDSQYIIYTEQIFERKLRLNTYTYFIHSSYFMVCQKDNVTWPRSLSCIPNRYNKSVTVKRKVVYCPIDMDLNLGLLTYKLSNCGLSASQSLNQ